MSERCIICNAKLLGWWIKQGLCHDCDKRLRKYAEKVWKSVEPHEFQKWYEENKIDLLKDLMNQTSVQERL